MRACEEEVIRFNVQALASVDDEEAFGATTFSGMDSTRLHSRSPRIIMGLICDHSTPAFFPDPC